MRALKHHLIWAMLAVSLILAVLQCWGIYRIHRENVLLNELAQGHDIEVEKLVTGEPQLRLARAIYLHQKHRYNEALDTLSLIVKQGDTRLQSQSRYNLGNVYLSQALSEVEAGHLNQALPMLSLAKQAYRQALTLDSQLWDAKYNLELAMSLLPELDRISVQQSDNDASQPSPLWTTVPGFPRGLP